MAQRILTPETLHRKFKRAFVRLDRELGPAVRTLLRSSDRTFVAQGLPVLTHLITQDRARHFRAYMLLIVHSVTLPNTAWGAQQERAWDPVIEEAEQIVKYLDCLLEDLSTLLPRSRQRKGRNP